MPLGLLGLISKLDCLFIRVVSIFLCFRCKSLIRFMVSDLFLPFCGWFFRGLDVDLCPVYHNNVIRMMSPVLMIMLLVLENVLVELENQALTRAKATF